MLPMVVKFYFKRNNIVSSYNPIRQTIPMVYNSIDEVKFALLLLLLLLLFIIKIKNRTRSTNMTSHIKRYKWSQ